MTTITREGFRFEPELAEAATLPSGFYLDAAVLADENDKLFGRTWQLVGSAAQVARPGDYITASIAGEPVLIVRGKDAQLRAMSNVCRHRAGPVASGAGNRPVLQCGYHGWTYALDGQLLTTPEFDGVRDFDRASTCLPQFRVASWGQLVFVCLDQSAPELSDVLGEIAAEFARRDFSTYSLVHSKEWVVACNWKVYVDNYLEGYHIPIVHPGLFRELDYPNYRTETRRWHSIQHSPIRRPQRLQVRQGQDDNEARYFWVFPNLMINVYPDNFSTNLILPTGPETTSMIFDWYFQSADPAKDVDRTVEFSDEVQLEDIAICEAVQRGLRSRTYDQGRYSVARENGVHHFHGLYAHAMGLT